MQGASTRTLDERISSDPFLQAEFLLYVFYQYNEGLTDAALCASLSATIGGKEKEFPEGSLEHALSSSLYGHGPTRNSFSKVEAVEALKKLKLNLEGAIREGHEFLNELVIRDYRIFESYLLNAYHEYMSRTSSIAAVHNYLDAEMEIYRAACFCFPGVRKHADDIFTRIYSRPSRSHDKDESARRIEFLQWFVGQYIIPAVDTIPSEWYYSRFRRLLNQRVLPIFRDVMQQRRSVYVVSGKTKNNIVLDDLLYGEAFNVKMSDSEALERGNLVECTVVRYASSNRINSIVRLIEKGEADKVLGDVNERRHLMSEIHDSFITAYGSEALLLGSPMEAIARFNEFMAKYSEEKGLKDAALPRLVNAEAFNSYQEFRAALLCETNNFYLSIYYPMLLDAIDGRMDAESAAQVTDICLTSPLALPFTSLRRIMVKHGARLLEIEGRVRPELDSLDSLRSMIMRERGHSWSYNPVPLVTGTGAAKPPAVRQSG